LHFFLVTNCVYLDAMLSFACLLKTGKELFGWSSMTYCTAPLIPMNIDPEWPSLRKILIQLLDLKGKYTGNIQTKIVSDLQGKEN